jgi:uncharacterized protein YoaH (UPF0181 family)
VQMLAGHMEAAALGRKARPGTVTALALDLTAALKDKPLPAAQATTLAQDVHAIFNSAHLSHAQQQTICDRVQGLLLKHGVSADQTASVVNGLTRVAAETK